jgi:effector-binding domain-containing protein
VKRNGIKTDGKNVAIYRGRTIEAGPRVIEPGDGSVATPGGKAAMVILMGPYELLGDVHKAIRKWCAVNGREIEGTNWEIYGHHEEDPAKRRTDVFYLLRG